MNHEEREARAKEIAAFRYSLIAELANPYLCKVSQFPGCAEASADQLTVHDDPSTYSCADK